MNKTGTSPAASTFTMTCGNAILRQANRPRDSRRSRRWKPMKAPPPRTARPFASRVRRAGVRAGKALAHTGWSTSRREPGITNA